MKCDRPFVRLGNNWRQFSLPKPGLQMLGTIQNGLEIGALAQIGAGRYVQVNGCLIQHLHAGRVEAAIERARQALLGRLETAAVSSFVAPALAEPEARVPADHSGPTSTPTVVYKRRRLIAPDLQTPRN